MRDYIFPPLFLPFFLIFIIFPFLLLIFFFATSQVFQIVFGLEKQQAMIVFFLILLGSLINIPLYEREGKAILRELNFFGIIYYFQERKKVTVAVNLGGCVFPSLLAIKLLFELPLTLWIIAFIISSLVIFTYARPVRGVGIAVPMIIPPLFSAIIGYLILYSAGYSLSILPKFTYSLGVLSALFGADILHLKDIEKIGGGVVSIGGAGTFDGIFLTGVFAVVFSVLLI